MNRRKLLFQGMAASSLLSTPFVWGCSDPNIPIKRFSFPIFGTKVVVLLRGDLPTSLIRKARFHTTRMLASIHSIFTVYQESPLTRLNATRAEKKVDIGEDIADVCALSLLYAQQSNGFFDPTVGALMTQYRKTANPNMDTLKKMRDDVGYQHVQLDGNSISFAKDHTALDFNAIVKGWAIDKLADVFQQHGIRHFLINAGGDIVARGHQGNQNGWEVWLEHPHKKSPKWRFVLQNEAIATSGNYTQHPREDGTPFLHLLHPRTAATSNEWISATVIAETAAEADAWATAAYIAGEAQLQFLDTGTKQFHFIDKK